jgi:hypothetical protein
MTKDQIRAMQQAAYDAYDHDHPQNRAGYDYVTRIIQYEAGELDESETIELFQYLVNDGLIGALQGSYQRVAVALIQAGLVTVPPPRK